jgi:hypothetical protein
MSSLHRLIAIFIIWVVAGGTLVSIFSVSFLNALSAPALLLLTAVIIGGASWATIALARP